MVALSTVVPAAFDLIPLPLVLTVALATVALVGLALSVRLARASGRLTGATATASGVTAAGIIASSLLLLVAFAGTPAVFPAPTGLLAPASVQSPAISGPAPASDDLSGYQLPTK